MVLIRPATSRATYLFWVRGPNAVLAGTMQQRNTFRLTRYHDDEQSSTHEYCPEVTALAQFVLLAVSGVWVMAVAASVMTLPGVTARSPEGMAFTATRGALNPGRAEQSTARHSTSAQQNDTQHRLSKGQASVVQGTEAGSRAC
jgi:hypothetical protein